EPAELENNGASVVTNLDVATRGIKTLRYFVCLFMRNNWSVCEKRHKEGYPALSVFWTQHTHNNISRGHYLKDLTRIITTKNNSPIVLVTEEKSEDEEKLHIDAVKLDSFLPNSMDSVISLGNDLESDSSWLKEIPSLSVGYENVKDVPPAFIIPGLQGSPAEYIKPLARKLMYPILCARIVEHKNTVAETAAVLVKSIQKVECTGPYNIVGISWGGAIALEVARLLEAEGHKIRIILVDAAPERMQAIAQQLTKDGTFDTNLVSALLKIKMKLNPSSGWSELLDEVLSSIPPQLHPHLKTALTSLRNSLTLLLDYEPSGDLLKGEVSLIRPSGASEVDNCGLDHFSKHTVKVHVVEGDHETMLWNPETARIINDFIV
ncbi:hypothetical protein L9F63_021356, partial [Diploptera punctata]